MILPFVHDIKARYQNNREYLGLLLSLLLVAISFPDREPNMSVMWVNDNTAALAWAKKGRVSNLSSQFACISVNWLQLILSLIHI